MRAKQPARHEVTTPSTAAGARGDIDRVPGMFETATKSLVCGTMAAVLAAAIPARPAEARARLSAQSKISVAGLPIGRGDLMADLSSGRYIAVGVGRAAGFLRVLVGGEGTVTASGAIRNGQLAASNFSAVLNADDERSTVTMSLDNGNVKDLTAESSAPVEDRVPLTDAHRHGVIDPVSAMLVPGALVPATCHRTLPIFDGRRRYDLKLSFKRMDRVKADDGYRGPVLVCAAELRAIAGHRADSTLVKYLSGSLELWLAPIDASGVLGPYRLSVDNLVGNLVIEAVRYQPVAEAPGPLRLP